VTMNSEGSTKPPPGPPPLPLSQTENGALSMAPLSTVVNSATDSLYQDLYNLVYSDVKIVSVAKNNTATNNSGGDGNASSAEDKLNATVGAPSNPNDALLETRKAKMANLSFAQRRHELTRRIVQHTKSVAHCYALTAASLPKSHSSLQYHKLLKSSSSSPLLSPTSSNAAKIHEPPPRLGATVQVSSDALQFVKSGWISQDEAQDALYFHHDELWKARGHCHDVLGALCVLSTPNHNDNCGGGNRGGGFWPDFPTDVALAVDPYGVSKEKSYSPSELKARLASAIRRKLVLGEVGSIRNNNEGKKLTSQLPWRIVFEQGGGSIRLTHGSPRTVSTAEALRQRSAAKEEEDCEINLQQYPMEARLSVLSEDSNASWKLLSLHVRCSPKTGESDHQLGMNKKQMFDLHRIGERAMIVEEAICRKANEATKNTTTTTTSEEENAMEIDGEKSIETTSSPLIPRPLLRLFEVTHAFSLSLQLEMLSSQAEALRRGAWGGAAGVKETLGDGIAVSPAYFFDSENDVGNKSDKNNRPAPIAVMAVHFWLCDGTPRVGDIICSDEDTANSEKDDSSSIIGAGPGQRRDDNFLPASDNKGKERLSLCIRAVPMVGLVVSLSGSDAENDMTSESHHLKRNADKLLSSIQNPFQLSMSDALLAATVLCAERRCHAVVDALNRTKASHLPPWIHLEVECGSITVAGRISYQHFSLKRRAPTVLFRLACDSRTGRFLPTFHRSISILRRLACNDPSTSDIQFVSNVAMASARQAKGNMFTKKVGERESTGRLVRDAFDALSRSMDTLGRKCGVGGLWNESDVLRSKSLREKSVEQSVDQTWASLITCSGIAAVFGVAGIALKVSSGVDPVIDMSGGVIFDEANANLIRVPPLSVPLSQKIVEKRVKEGDGETKTKSELQSELFAVSAKANTETLELVCFDVLTTMKSASSVPMRMKYASIKQLEGKESAELDAARPAKRVKTSSESKCQHILTEVEHATQWIDAVLGL